MDNYQKRRPNNQRNNNMRGGRRYNNNRNQGGGHQGGSDLNTARQRRAAMAAREKYMNMARDALSGGDRVQAEYFFQHAEHYYRVLAALPPEEVPVARGNYGNASGIPDQEGLPPEGEMAPVSSGEEAPQGNRRPPQRQAYDNRDMPPPMEPASDDAGLPPFITRRGNQE